MFLLLLLVSFCLAWWLAVILDIVFIGHDFTTTKQAAKVVARILEKYGKHQSVVYDLGSGRGDFLLDLKKFSKNIKPIGIDSSRFRIFLSRIKALVLQREVKFLKSDFKNLNISEAEVIYIYLKQPHVSALASKLQTELKPGTLIITNTQNISALVPNQIFITHPKKPEYEKMFVYVK